MLSGAEQVIIVDIHTSVRDKVEGRITYVVGLVYARDGVSSVL